MCLHVRMSSRQACKERQASGGQGMHCPAHRTRPPPWLRLRIAELQCRHHQQQVARHTRVRANAAKAKQYLRRGRSGLGRRLLAAVQKLEHVRQQHLSEFQRSNRRSSELVCAVGKGCSHERRVCTCQHKQHYEPHLKQVQRDHS